MEPHLTSIEEALAKELSQHHLSNGMVVAMGVTCQCGYWTGNEPEAGKRPLPWGRDQLGLHRARVAVDFLLNNKFVDLAR